MAPDRVHTSVTNGIFGWEQTLILAVDYRIALACLRFKSGAIEHGYVAATVLDQSRLLQFSSGVRDAFATHPQHFANSFLRHSQFVRGHAVQA
jgi:hypothetical protein